MPRILLIEDSPTQAAHFARMLESAGFEVEKADSLGGGLERIKRGDIEALLLDLTLPDSEGLQTFLTAHARARGTPIVVLTHRDDEDLATTTLEHGAQDYLVKGEVNQNWLSRAIRHAIARGRSRDDKPTSLESNDEAFKVLTVVEFEESGDVTIARIHERRLLDARAIAVLNDCLQGRVTAGCKMLAISLADVEYVSNGALGVLLAVRRRTLAQNGSVCLCEVGEYVYEQLTTRQFHKLFDVHDTVDDAIASLKAE